MLNEGVLIALIGAVSATVGLIVGRSRCVWRENGGMRFGFTENELYSDNKFNYKKFELKQNEVLIITNKKEDIEDGMEDAEPPPYE